MPKDYNWEEDYRFAADAARKVGRPLLIRGEPGIGKSSLAKAYADDNQMTYISDVVTAHTEANDLLWRFDGIKRLGDAHCCCDPQKNIDLSAKRYLSPGLLWWAFNGLTAKNHYEQCPGGVYPALNYDPLNPMQRDWVVLVDEIDKADSSVPNSLLGALANGKFTVPHLEEPVALSEEAKPLIVFTTNEDRELPPAFLRRCFVLHMTFPQSEEKAVSWLVECALATKGVEDKHDYLEKIAKRFLKERSQIRGRYAPGLSEYLDLIQVLQGFPDREKIDQELPRFVLDKNSLATRYSE